MTNLTINTKETTVIRNNKEHKQYFDLMLKENLITLPEWNILVDISYTNILNVSYGSESMRRYMDRALTDIGNIVESDNGNTTDIFNCSVTPLHGEYELGEYRIIEPIGLEINIPAKMEDVFTVTTVVKDHTVIKDCVKKRERDNILYVYIPSDRL